VLFLIEKQLQKAPKWVFFVFDKHREIGVAGYVCGARFTPHSSR
jgi:hypothetical protein